MYESEVFEKAILVIDEDFKLLFSFYDIFGVLLKFKDMTNLEIVDQCKKLDNALISGENHDIGLVLMADELALIKTSLPSNIDIKPPSIPTFILEKQILTLFPNCMIAF